MPERYYRGDRDREHGSENRRYTSRREGSPSERTNYYARDRDWRDRNYRYRDDRRGYDRYDEIRHSYYRHHNPGRHFDRDHDNQYNQGIRADEDDRYTRNGHQNDEIEATGSSEMRVRRRREQCDEQESHEANRNNLKRERSEECESEPAKRRRSGGDELRVARHNGRGADVEDDVRSRMNGRRDFDRRTNYPYHQSRHEDPEGNAMPSRRYSRNGEEDYDRRRDRAYGRRNRQDFESREEEQQVGRPSKRRPNDFPPAQDDRTGRHRTTGPPHQAGMEGTPNTGTRTEDHANHGFGARDHVDQVQSEARRGFGHREADNNRFRDGRHQESAPFDRRQFDRFDTPRPGRGRRFGGPNRGGFQHMNIYDADGPTLVKEVPIDENMVHDEMVFRFGSIVHVEEVWGDNTPGQDIPEVYNRVEAEMRARGERLGPSTSDMDAQKPGKSAKEDSHCNAKTDKKETQSRCQSENKDVKREEEENRESKSDPGSSASRLEQESGKGQGNAGMNKEDERTATSCVTEQIEVRSEPSVEKGEKENEDAAVGRVAESGSVETPATSLPQNQPNARGAERAQQGNKEKEGELGEENCSPVNVLVEKKGKE